MIGRKLYVILGIRDFEVPKDTNVYIDVNQFQNLNSLKDAIAQNRMVCSQVIFLIPDERFREKAKQIMLNVGVNDGLIQAFSMKEKEEVQEEEVYEENEVNEDNNLEENSLANDEVFPSAELPLEENADIEEEPLPQINVSSGFTGELPKSSFNPNAVSSVNVSSDTGVKLATTLPKTDEEIPYSYKRENNIFKKNDEAVNPYASSDKSSASYMGYNPTLVSRNVKTLVRTPQRPKSKAFIQLPVIIFILSALLLIASGVLLFVLD